MNYQEMLDKTLLEIGDSRPRLLLHACCAPCASYPLEYLSGRFDITVYYFNPNIMPLEEYEKRRGEFEKLRVFPFTFVSEPWDNARYLELVRGHENDREGGDRCTLCFRLRLEETAKKAKAEGFDFFATTLTVSPHKNAQIINTIGEALSEEYKVPWLYTDFKKREGYKRSTQLCRELDIYRQMYCGCRLGAAEG